MVVDGEVMGPVVDNRVEDGTDTGVEADFGVETVDQSADPLLGGFCSVFMGCSGYVRLLTSSQRSMIWPACTPAWYSQHHSMTASSFARIVVSRVA